jgi:hypothetical protein
MEATSVYDCKANDGIVSISYESISDQTICDRGDDAAGGTFIEPVSRTSSSKCCRAGTGDFLREECALSHLAGIGKGLPLRQDLQQCVLLGQGPAPRHSLSLNHAQAFRCCAKHTERITMVTEVQHP